ncbi:AMP-binding protein [Streptosporangium sp. NPDC006013]|uniref:AMP-binding protein n=1 Tax=Streptosporangium sp. NPDC006013 TaxID=3155596 RepID=UPI0033A62DD4
MPTEAHFASIWEATADAIGDHVAVSHGDRAITWAGYEERAARLASALVESGLRPGSKVGLYLFNTPEYLEAQFAAFKIRAVPVNVNYRYLDDELWYLLDNADAEAVVFDAALAGPIGRVRDRLPQVRLWIRVGDDGDATEGDVGVPYEQLVSAHQPAPRINRDPDDVYMLYTGGTTGMPKGVMFPMGEFTRRWIANAAGLLGQPDVDDPAWAVATAAALAEQGTLPRFVPACPLMHGTGMWLGVLVPQMVGGRVVLLPGRGFDADELWTTVGREAANGIVIVGDAFARPMLRALESAQAAGRPYDASSVQLVLSSGAMLSAGVRQSLVERLPAGAAIGDMMGATEGPGGSAVSTRDQSPGTARFLPTPDTKVFTPDWREVVPGSGEQGMLAVSGAGNVPIGYYKDEERTARLVKVVDGVRYSVPGDWAQVEADGTVSLLGRGSGCINTAGEKVYAEEVEETVKLHPAIEDCLVFGVPDDRLGQRVVALVSSRTGPAVSGDDVTDWTRKRLAGFKVPKEVHVVETMPRAANGKADLRTARALFAELAGSPAGAGRGEVTTEGARRS